MADRVLPHISLKSKSLNRRNLNSEHRQRRAFNIELRDDMCSSSQKNVINRVHIRTRHFTQHHRLHDPRGRRQKTAVYRATAHRNDLSSTPKDGFISKSSIQDLEFRIVNRFLAQRSLLGRPPKPTDDLFSMLFQQILVCEARQCVIDQSIGTILIMAKCP